MQFYDTYVVWRPKTYDDKNAINIMLNIVFYYVIKILRNIPIQSAFALILIKYRFQSYLPSGVPKRCRCHTNPIAFISFMEFQGMISFSPLHSVEPRDWLRGECDIAMYGPSKLTGMLMGWDIECFPTFFLRLILSRSEGCMHIGK